MSATLKKGFGSGGAHLDREGKDGETLYDLLKTMIELLQDIKTKYDAHDHNGTADPPAADEKFTVDLTVE